MEYMHLWARINGKDYPVAYGANFKDNYSDTLDSGTIIIPHVVENDPLESAKPSDDVIVHSEDWLTVIAPKKSFHHIYSPASGEVYRHLLIGTINSTKVFMDDGITLSDYNYTITLVSETQGLENCLMPNRTITQPQVTNDGSLGESSSNSKSVYFWAKHYVERYGGYVKKTDDGSTWSYVSRYVLADSTTGGNSVLAKFDSILCPEFSIGMGTLRQALTQLFSVADCIPVVHDGVISYLDLSARVGNGISKNAIPGKSWESFSMNGGEYADRVRKNYSQALSKDATTTYIENLGFRNSTVASMGFSDLKLEFKHPIYSIKKLYMCYYKKQSNENVVLIKQNITPLIVLDSKRNLLSIDWPKFDATTKYTIDDFAKYKFCTLGYSIGSKEINGFGSYLEYTTNGLFNTKKTYLENIIEIMDAMYPWGEGFGAGEYLKKNSINVENLLVPNSGLDDLEFPSIVSPVTDTDNVIKNILVDNLGIMSDRAIQQKAVFFKCEYEGFIESSVIYSKDYHDGWVSKIDSPSGSLQIIETEGSATKEKINKLGNKTLITKARISYGQTDTLGRNAETGVAESALVELGEYSKGFDNDDYNDLIVYIRDISYDISGINIVYYQCKDYVLRNFYTSVFAKIRPFALASYEESVKRLENRTIEILFSEDKSYYQSSSKQFSFNDVSKIISFANQDSVSKYFQYYSPIETKYSYTVLLKKDGSEASRYLVENQKFVSGDALCFDVEMVDNVSAGTYIKQYAPNFSSYLMNYINGIASNSFARYGTDKTALNDITGTVQDWNMLVGNLDYNSTFIVSSLNVNYENFNDLEKNMASAITSSIASLYDRGYRFYSAMTDHYNDGTKENYKFSYYLIGDDLGIGDPETGYIKNIGFQIDPSNGIHDDKYDSTFDDPSSETTVKEVIYPEYLMNLPLESHSMRENDFGSSDSLSCVEENKDGKEIINETFEIEPISDTPNIRFSPYMMKLSSLYGKYRKCWTSKSAGYPNLDAFIAVSSMKEQEGYRNYSSGISYFHRENPMICVFVSSEVMESNSKFIDFVNFFNKKEISLSWTSAEKSAKSKNENVDDPNRNVYVTIKKIASYNFSSKTITIEYDEKIVKKSDSTVETNDSKTITLSVDNTKASPIGYSMFYFNIFENYETPEDVRGLNPGKDYNDGKSASNDCSYGGLVVDDSDLSLWDALSKYFNHTVSSIQYSMKIPQGCGFSFVSPDVSTIRTLFAFVSSDKMTMQNENQLDFVSIPSNMSDISDTFSINGKSKSDLISDASSDNNKFSLFKTAGYERKLSLSFPTSGKTSGSVRFYYYDSTGDKRYHFVYGQNFDSTEATATVTAYVSVMDDRSRTVIDGIGDPVYKIVNYADNPTGVPLGNYCVVK